MPEEHVEITSFEDTDINMKNWLIQDVSDIPIISNTYISPAKLYIYGQGMVLTKTKTCIGKRSCLEQYRGYGHWESRRVEIHKYEYSPKTHQRIPVSAVWDDFRDVNKSNVWISDFDGTMHRIYLFTQLVKLASGNIL